MDRQSQGEWQLIRTFPSWALLVESEGHWPWQRGPAESEHRQGPGTTRPARN